MQLHSALALLEGQMYLRLEIRTPAPEGNSLLLQIANMLGVSHQAVHGFIKAARKRLHTEHRAALEEAFLNPAPYGMA